MYALSCLSPEYAEDQGSSMPLKIKQGDPRVSLETVPQLESHAGTGAWQ